MVDQVVWKTINILVNVVICLELLSTKLHQNFYQ